MIKVDIVSGFLGAGKTTLITKLLSGLDKNEKIAIIENEFGEIGIDGAFLKNSGIEIKEINSGCICCSLVGNFADSLKELVEKYSPNRIIIEPSGVGKLSDVVKAINGAGIDVKVNIVCTVVDGGKCKMYYKNFGEFYLDQIKEASVIVISKTEKLSEEKLIETCEFIKTYNPTATLITTPISQLDGKLLVENLEDGISLTEMLIAELKKHEHGHHHHHHDEECHCHEHEHYHEECHCHEHEHEHDEECHCHEHEHEHVECHCHDHEHDHDEECHCHDHDHGECCCGHHHHHAEEVFESVAIETPKAYSKDELVAILNKLCTEEFGTILRAKGMLKSSESDLWHYFDLVAGDFEVRTGAPDVIGKACVIGSKINKEEIKKLF
ncbi:MAG: cobalamin biosynthesis protein CobW [Clostridia bacterium]|nr:cobalamin biosynthesis protein CobW [Clostridia bacterium]